MFSKVFFKSHPLKVKSFLISSAVATFTCAVLANTNTVSTDDSNAYHVSVMESARLDSASLTSCIDKTGLANEIEITGRAMKKAVNDVLGYSLKPVVEREEKVPYCALNLA